MLDIFDARILYSIQCRANCAATCKIPRFEIYSVHTKFHIKGAIPMVRTRYAPSPTGYMHIGNLRSALFEYLIAKHSGGTFILRIEDTDQNRYVEGATEIIYKTLRTVGMKHDEGPDVGGDYGPYVQSERKNNYIEYAKQLVKSGHAYYCFCSKERLGELHENSEHDVIKYDRHCLGLSQDEIDAKLAEGVPFVIRQKIPEGSTSFHDEVYGDITIKNEEMEDQILIKSDLMPTYNFANVVDDHLMKITHVVRGNEYLSSTPKYNLLYNAFGWEIPTYVHLPLIVNEEGKKLAKRSGDVVAESLFEAGFLPDAVINYIALLGWSPSENREIYSLSELAEAFDIKGISKSPAIYDMKKLTWMNAEYIKLLPAETFYEMALPYIKEAVTRTDVDLRKLAAMTQTRVEFARDAKNLLDFIDTLPEYDTPLFVHKKMKTDVPISLTSLEKALPVLEGLEDWREETIHAALFGLIEEMQIKNGQMLWPIRTALSGKPSSPCGATELAEILGKADCIARIKTAIEKLREAVR